MAEQFISIGDNERQACGLLPGRMVSSFCVTLPALPPSKLERALPHIMSDYLTDDAAALAFCHMPAPQGDKHIVLAVARSVLDALMDDARAQEIELQAIWPDYMALAQPESGVAVMEDGDDVMARRADGTGFRLPKALATPLLGDIETHQANQSGVPRDMQGFAIGRYGTQLPLAALLQSWQRPLLLATAALTLWLGATLFDAISNERQRHAMQVQAEQRLMALFPETRRIVNLEAQLRNKLGMSGSASFSGQVSKLMGVLAALPTTRLDAIEFDSGRTQALEITLQTTDFSALETTRLRLVQAGFRVAEGKSEQNGELVIGRFNLSAGGR